MSPAREMTPSFIREHPWYAPPTISGQYKAEKAERMLANAQNAGLKVLESAGPGTKLGTRNATTHVWEPVCEVDEDKRWVKIAVPKPEDAKAVWAGIE